MEEIAISETDPLFAARLTPYRSLGRTGYLVLMSFIGLTCLISGLLFLVIGAWPVFGFFGLDLFLIWLAFKMSYRSARAYEEVSVWRHQLKIDKISPSGKVKTYTLNPFWTRFVVDRHDEIGITKMSLSTKDANLEIGSFLNPLDRESFARAFGSALSRARNY